LSVLAPDNGIVMGTMASEKRLRQKANKAAAAAQEVKSASNKKQRRNITRVVVVVILIVSLLYFNQPEPGAVDTGADLPITTEAPTP
jgi:hypothetical protein